MWKQETFSLPDRTITNSDCLLFFSFKNAFDIAFAITAVEFISKLKNKIFIFKKLRENDPYISIIQLSFSFFAEL